MGRMMDFTTAVPNPFRQNVEQNHQLDRGLLINLFAGKNYT